jgi:methanogenic corrinoid protein MtbC1
MSIQNPASNLEHALIKLDRESARQIISESAHNTTAIETASILVTSALDSIGRGWEEGRYSLSQVYLSGLICKEIVDRILPPKAPERMDQPPMAIGVFGDYHMLGKRIIYSTLRAGGYELMDMGNGLSTMKVLEFVKTNRISILMLSTLMLPSALKIKELTEMLGGSGVKVVVGGAPFRFDPNLWKEVGADATGKNPEEALAIVNELSSGLK